MFWNLFFHIESRIDKKKFESRIIRQICTVLWLLKNKIEGKHASDPIGSSWYLKNQLYLSNCGIADLCSVFKLVWRTDKKAFRFDVPNNYFLPNFGKPFGL